MSEEVRTHRWTRKQYDRLFELGLLHEDEPIDSQLDAERIAMAFGLTVSALAKPVGVTPSALSRRRTAPAAQRGLRELEFVWAVLRRELGADDVARAWLHAGHPLLDGEAPIALLTKGSATALADFVRSAVAGQPT